MHVQHPFGFQCAVGARPGAKLETGDDRVSVQVALGRPDDPLFPAFAAEVAAGCARCVLVAVPDWAARLKADGFPCRVTQRRRIEEIDLGSVDRWFDGSRAGLRGKAARMPAVPRGVVVACRSQAQLAE